MKALQLTAYGAPADVLQVNEISEPGTPKSGEVLIQVQYSPVNHSDILLINGLFPLRPELPSTIGGEGVGIVLSVGEGVENLKEGDTVTIPFGIGAWAERIIAPATSLYKASKKTDLQQASMHAINPPTAVLLVTQFVDLEKGAWIVFNAANSAMARNIIAVAKSRGIKTLGIVRRKEAVADAEAAGADAVLIDTPEIAEKIGAITGNANIQLALDAVGGEATNTLAKIIGVDSHIVVYAIMSGDPIIVNQPDLIGKRVKVHGFNMFYPQFQAHMSKALDETSLLLEQGNLSVPIAATYSLSEFNHAIEHTLRGGKVLFDLSK